MPNQLPSFMNVAAPGGVEGIAGAPQQNRLAVPLMVQENDNWCWAAVTQAILSFVHNRSVTQEDIATEHARSTGKDYVCSPPNGKVSRGGSCLPGQCTGTCNDNHLLWKIMTEQTCLRGVPQPGVPPYALIQGEIGNRRPIACLVRWWLGGGHFILITGYMTALDGRQRVDVLDSKLGARGSAAGGVRIDHAHLRDRYGSSPTFGRVTEYYLVQ